jgi:chlorite dismutase
MDAHNYHHYLFFKIDKDFYRLTKEEQQVLTQKFSATLTETKSGDFTFDAYSTLGFKPDAVFMLWCRGNDPAGASILLHKIFHTEFGPYLSLSYTFFGIIRNSAYSGRPGKPEQSIQHYDDRLPYLVLYPFTKTSEWHALEFEKRKSIMGEHIKVGLGHPAIRQCLLYSYGVDDYEFLVSYETKTLEEFQDLVIEMRRTAGRKYTLVDTPTFTCIYKTLPELIALL